MQAIFTEANYEKISLRDVEIRMVLGIAEWEKTPGRTQRVIVNIDLFRSGAPVSKTIDDAMDYDRVYRYVTETWPTRPHTDLIETLASDLAAVCLEDAKVEACRVHIRKPDVYQGRGHSEIEVVRTR